MKKRNGLSFILCIGLLASCNQHDDSPFVNNSTLEEVTIAQLRGMMQRGEINSVHLVEYYIHRIAEIDPSLNSVLEINPDVYDIAADLDEERLAGHIRSYLHGIPVLLKDNIDTADKMLTTAGSLALIEAPKPSKDALLVQNLRAAGAIMLGKTNLSEWANFRSTRSVSGWSARGGQTHNPYVLDRSPCGSSAGSAVAVSANLTVVSVGTETDGSIVCPAAVNGIVGIKPTLGLVPPDGIIPLAHSMDTAGPMARTVTDAVLLLNAMVGRETSNVDSSHSTMQFEKDYTVFLRNDGLMGKRIGVLRQLFNKYPELNEIMTGQLDILKAGGAKLIDVEIEPLTGLWNAEFKVLLYEFKANINRYLKYRGGRYQSLEMLIEFNRSNAKREMRYFGQDIFELASAKGNLSEEAYVTAQKKTKEFSQDHGIDALIAEHQLDAIVAPASGIAWLVDFIRGDRGGDFIGSSTLAATAGYPSITVPAGLIKELPVGILFLGPAYSEPTLIAIAYDYEQRTSARRAPLFLETYQ